MNTTKVCIASWATTAVILSASAWVMVFGQQQVAADHQAALERVAAMEAAQPPLVVNSDGMPVMEQSMESRSSIPVIDSGAVGEDIRRATSALNEQISAAEEEIRQLRAALAMKP